MIKGYVGGTPDAKPDTGLLIHGPGFAINTVAKNGLKNIEKGINIKIGMIIASSPTT